MKNKFFSILLFAGIISTCLISCKEDPTPYIYRSYNGWTYTDGDADINNQEDVEIEFDIESNLNVDGIAVINAGISIGNDLNLNDDGKVIIETPNASDTVFINGNMNLNDSLIFVSGFVLLDGNLNINSNGVLVLEDSSKMHITGDLNNSGDIYGYDKISVDGEKNLNSGSVQ